MATTREVFQIKDRYGRIVEFKDRELREMVSEFQGTAANAVATAEGAVATANSAVERVEEVYDDITTAASDVSAAVSGVESARLSAQTSAEQAAASALEAYNSANAASASEASIMEAETNAALSAEAATNSRQEALFSAQSAQNSASLAETAANDAAQSATAADASETSAALSAANAAESASSASTSAQQADGYVSLSMSYARGDSGIRTGEETDNAKYYAEQAELKTSEAAAAVTAAENAARETSDQIINEVSNVFPDKTKSGRMVVFDDGTGFPLKDMSVEMVPYQGGSGDPSPENVREIYGFGSVLLFHGGKNMLSLPSQRSETRNGITFSIDENGVTLDGTSTSHVDFSCSPLINLAPGRYIITGCPENGAQGTWNLDIIKYDYVTNLSSHQFDYGQGVTFDVTEYDKLNCSYSVRINIGSNVTPPSNWVPMLRSADIEDGSAEKFWENSYTITPPNDITFYGGTIDVINGEMVITWTRKNVDGEDWTVVTIPSVTNRVIFQKNINWDETPSGTVLCNRLKPVSSMTASSDAVANTVYVDENQIMVCLPVDNAGTVTGQYMSDWIESNPLQIAYEFDAGIEYNVDPIKINTVSGCNYFAFARYEDGEINLTYRAGLEKDVISYEEYTAQIDQMIDDQNDLIAANNTAQVALIDQQTTSKVAEQVAAMQVIEGQTVIDSTLTVTGAAAEAAKVGTEITALKNDLSGIGYGALPSKSASGSVVTFSDGADGAALKNLVLNLEPTQSGSGGPSPSNIRPITGYDSVSVVREGKNKLPFPYSDASKTSNGVTYTINSDGSVTAKGTAAEQSFFNFNLDIVAALGLIEGNKIYITTGVAYNTSCYCRLLYHDDYSGIGRLTSTDNEITITSKMVTRGAVFQIFTVKGATVNATFYPMIRLSQSESTTYEPYQGTTYPISLSTAGTVYGGTLDVTTGELVVDRGFLEFDGTEGWKETGAAGTQHRFYLTLPTAIDLPSTSYASFLRSSCFSDLRESGNSGTWGTAVLSSTMVKLLDMDGNFSGVSALKTWIADNYSAGTPMQFTYPLGTPLTYHLTPTEVTTLLGENTIWMDAEGTIDATYRVDTQMYVDNRIKSTQGIIAPVEDSYTATANYAIGDYLIVEDTLYIVTAAIASGGTITPDSNVTATTVMAQIKALA